MLPAIFARHRYALFAPAGINNVGFIWPQTVNSHHCLQSLPFIVAQIEVHDSSFVRLEEVKILPVIFAHHRYAVLASRGRNHAEIIWLQRINEHHCRDSANRDCAVFALMRLNTGVWLFFFSLARITILQAISVHCVCTVSLPARMINAFFACPVSPTSLPNRQYYQ